MVAATVLLNSCALFHSAAMMFLVQASIIDVNEGGGSSGIPLMIFWQASLALDFAISRRINGCESGSSIRLLTCTFNY